jgi:hypothetical protein
MTDGQRLQDVSACISSAVAGSRGPTGSERTCETTLMLATDTFLADLATIMVVPQLLTMAVTIAVVAIVVTWRIGLSCYGAKGIDVL